jgi:MFS superfamily sulfate permease-like transporter
MLLEFMRNAMFADDIFIGDVGRFTITMLPAVIVISIVEFIESFSVAKTYALKSGDKLDADQELVGLGFANTVGGIVGAFPTTGGLSRTAVHADAGVKTQLSGFISGVLLLLVIFFLLPLFELLPEVTLASIIIVAITGMMGFSVPVRLWRINRSDFFVWCLTFLLTLLVGVEPGVLFGTLFSLLVVLRNASRPHWAVLGLLKGSTPDNPVYRNIKYYPYSTQEEPGVRILRFDSQLFFANSEFFVSNVTELGTHKIDWINLVSPSMKGCSLFGLTDFHELAETGAIRTEGCSDRYG